MSERSLDLTALERQQLGRAALEWVTGYFDAQSTLPVYPPISATALSSALAGPLPLDPQPVAEVMAQFEQVVHASRHNGHPRMFGYVQSSGSFAGVIGDFLASALNQNVTSWRSAPSATTIEHQVIDWLKAMVGFDASGTGVLLSGGSFANFAGLAVALRASTNADVNQRGVTAFPDDDYVFRPPPAEEPAPPAREEPAMADDIIPTEEVPVESPREEQERWAPPQRSEDPDAQWRQGPPDFLAEEAAQEEIVEAQVVQDEEVLEAELVEDEPAPPPPPPALAEEEIFEAELVEEDEPVLEMEVVPEEAEAPAPTGAGDLYRLRGFDPGAESALGKAGIREVAHLAGHDAGELAQRTGIAFDRILPWIQVADLVQDVGVPMDAANALVAAGVAGPRGLAESDPDEIVDRVSAFGGATLDARDVRRWKRRA